MSVVFTVNKTVAPPAVVEINIPVEGFARPGVHVMLFVWEEYLDELEVMGPQGRFLKRLPEAESLEVFIES